MTRDQSATMTRLEEQQTKKVSCHQQQRWGDEDTTRCYRDDERYCNHHGTSIAATTISKKRKLRTPSSSPLRNSILRESKYGQPEQWTIQSLKFRSMLLLAIGFSVAGYTVYRIFPQSTLLNVCAFYWLLSSYVNIVSDIQEKRNSSCSVSDHNNNNIINNNNNNEFRRPVVTFTSDTKFYRSPKLIATRYHHPKKQPREDVTPNPPRPHQQQRLRPQAISSAKVPQRQQLERNPPREYEYKKLAAPKRSNVRPLEQFHQNRRYDSPQQRRRQ